MKLRSLIAHILLTIAFLPSGAFALVMRDNGPEPVIVQIKESLRTSDDLDNKLNDFAAARQQNGFTVNKWWAGSKLLVMLSFPSRFNQQQAMQAMARLQQHPAVEKVVPVSASNLEFKPVDFKREFGANDTLPDVARRGFDADRIGKNYPVPQQATLDAHPHAPNRLIVRWKEELIWKADQTGFAEQLASFHSRNGCRVVEEFRYSPTKLTQIVEFDPAQLPDKLQRYMDTGWAVYVDADYLLQVRNAPNDPAYSGYPGPQWTLSTISAPQAWDLTTGDPSVILAVGDTGANVNHPEFSTNLWWGQNNGDIHNFAYNSTNVDDDFSYQNVFHGSNVASIIAAQGNNGVGLTGVTWHSSLMILKVGNSGGSASISSVISAIQYAWQHNATAINLSLGWTGNWGYDCYYDSETRQTVCDTSEPFERTLFDALRDARNHGLAVVSAVGNDNNDDDGVGDNPAGIPTDNNIAVMATDRYDNRASYSNGVPYSSYGRGRVDLAAPGGRDNDTVIGLKQDWNGNSYDPANYSYDYGTSMATPHVTGALGLIKSRFPWESYSGIRDRVLMGVDRTGTLGALCRTEGRLNVYKALQTRSMFRNLSTRARVEGGDRAMIGGFIIGGSRSGGPLKVGIRGLGPSVGVSVARLNNPKIEIYGPNGYYEANDDWATDWNAADTIASGLQPSDPYGAGAREAVMVRWLNPGSYSVVVSSSDGQYGVGQFEVYELQGNTNEESRLLNLSTRCLVGVGEEQAVAGAIIGDLNNTGLPKPDRRVLIFGKGPSLAVSTPLGDPQIQVSTTGDYNNNYWDVYGPLQEELGEAGLAPSNGYESALWPTWQPGFYTVVMSGVNNGTGIGQLELYEY